MKKRGKQVKINKGLNVLGIILLFISAFILLFLFLFVLASLLISIGNTSGIFTGKFYLIIISAIILSLAGLIFSIVRIVQRVRYLRNK
ncbi:hypothetical protein J4408_03160 [Candidatus Pacearchaeota archaeon]|nr:hypothetical protein [Candidatus Pacearchaeota archaeon]